MFTPSSVNAATCIVNAAGLPLDGENMLALIHLLWYILYKQKIYILELNFIQTIKHKNTSIDTKNIRK